MKIGDLARRTGLSVDTLRYYEKINLLPSPSRDRGGRRLYDDISLRWIDFLKRLKATGMPLADMIRYARLREAGDSTSAARRELLEIHRVRVLGARDMLNENIVIIDGKIETYHAIEAGFAGPGEPESQTHDNAVHDNAVHDNTVHEPVISVTNPAILSARKRARTA